MRFVFFMKNLNLKNNDLPNDKKFEFETMICICNGLCTKSLNMF